MMAVFLLAGIGEPHASLLVGGPFGAVLGAIVGSVWLRLKRR
jgi:hypothetical protein